MKDGIVCPTWDDVENELFTPEEIAESNLRVALIGEIIKARKEEGITQQELEKRTGLTQAVISRMETGNTHTQLDTVLKVLAAMGKTLAIVPINDEVRREAPTAKEMRT
ncbi:MAG: helix-turn-helix domain-containing protein [Oscillospiraceae bacterium]|nr:helix-turn-helix domain-containing protein [Oscillospiraceae bacterium]